MKNIQSYDDFLNEGKFGRVLAGTALGAGLLFGSPAIGHTNVEVGTEQTQNVPKIGDNTIIINNVTDSTAFIKIKKILITNGYKVTESDKEIGYLSTDFKPFEGSMIAVEPKMSVTIIIENNVITMYANYKFKGSNALGGDSYEGRADYQKRENIGRRMAFDQLTSLAGKISNTFGSTITFTTQ